MNIASWFYYHSQKFQKMFARLLIVAGPGLMVMIADNDAGGITTYAATGAQFKYEMIWFLLLLIPIAYFVQEMAARTGVATKRGHAVAIFEYYGYFWGWFTLIDLVILNWMTLVTEFIGITAAFSVFGVPAWIPDVGVVVLLGTMVLGGSYWTWEKISLAFCMLNLIYIPCVFWLKPDMGAVLHGFIPKEPSLGWGDPGVLMFLMANIGTTIAPWMIFFQQSAVVDKGLKEKDIGFGRFETLFGSILTVTVAICIVITTGTLLPGVNIESGDQAAKAIMPFSQGIGTALAVGLATAGLVGAICITLASSWSFAEVFGWPSSLNKKVREAPWFYGLYFFQLISAAAVVLIPNAPLVLMTIFVQVFAMCVLPTSMVFMLLILNDKNDMGALINKRWENICTGLIIVFIIILSTLYGLMAIWPDLLGGAK